ncbi:MAG: DUF962 domain-containing protein [Burkholderiaceae bacterium]|nr:DUF962 domain-containing protein [Burkholderiaceae bacterium]
MDTTAGGAAAPTARRLDRLLAHYAESHRHPTNEIIHFVAIPAIMLSLIGLIYWIHPWAAYGLLLGSLAYYVMLRSPVLLVGMAVAAALSLVAVRAMGDRVLPICLAIFVIAWIFQFVGHRIEGRKPSFFEDLQYLLVGPLFVLTHALARLRIRW